MHAEKKPGCQTPKDIFSIRDKLMKNIQDKFKKSVTSNLRELTKKTPRNITFEDLKKIDPSALIDLYKDVQSIVGFCNKRFKCTVDTDLDNLDGLFKIHFSKFNPEVESFLSKVDAAGEVEVKRMYAKEALSAYSKQIKEYKKRGTPIGDIEVAVNSNFQKIEDLFFRANSVHSNPINYNADPQTLMEKAYNFKVYFNNLGVLKQPGPGKV